MAGASLHTYHRLRALAFLLGLAVAGPTQIASSGAPPLGQDTFRLDFAAIALSRVSVFALVRDRRRHPEIENR